MCTLVLSGLRVVAPEKVVGDAAGTGDGFVVEPIVELLGGFPQSDPAAERDRSDDDVELVDKPCLDKRPDGRRAAANANVESPRGDLRSLDGLDW